MAVTGDPTYSAAKAGYAHPQPRGSDNLAKPAVQAEIVRIQVARLYNETLPLAIEEHISLLRNSLTPAGAKVQAIKLAYDQTLGREGAAGGKDPSEMNGEELALEIEKLKRAAADRAKPVIEHESTAFD
jgi:phage terminase small subunit